MKSRTKYFFVLLTPFLLLVAAAVFTALFWQRFPRHQPYAFPEGRDVIGFFSDFSVQANVDYKLAWRVVGPNTLAPEGNLSVTFQGPAAGPLKILIPPSAVILSKDVQKEATFQGLHAFSTDLSLEEEEEKTLHFRYRLEPQASPYTLLFIPGRTQIQYHISAIFPDFIETKKSSIAGKTKNRKVINMDYFPAVSPLTLQTAEWENLQTIALTFNRSLSSLPTADILNFSLRDLNVKNKEVTDRIFVEEARVEGKKLLLRLRGATPQPGEHYELSLQNIEDKNGMPFSGAPLRLELTQPMLY